MESNHDAIENKAVEFARKNKKKIAKRFTNSQVFLPDREPVSVFMAGSPGAGKTEASKSLLGKMEKVEKGRKVLRIDPDELRLEFADYHGSNSWLFQPAVSILVDRIHDLALQQQQSFILDGTLSNYVKAEENIDRSLRRNRQVQILYVYLTPEQAWEFVQKREKKEGRKILPERFVEQYFAARENVNNLKNRFRKDISVDLILKEIDGSRKLYKAGVDQIDHHIPENFTKTDIEKLIGMR
ncbi:MAG: zeta toxin family protein [Gammaproteobacteria bacterium]|nr:zeta toxin family protein [Gammaproteobacteria bacterium]